jgi:hypothetical protein
VTGGDAFQVRPHHVALADAVAAAATAAEDDPHIGGGMNFYRASEDQHDERESADEGSEERM